MRESYPLKSIAGYLEEIVTVAVICILFFCSIVFNDGKKELRKMKPRTFWGWED